MQERILSHLEKYGSITTWEAIREYGCTRLSQYIYALRKEKYNIQDEWIENRNRYGDNAPYKKYILVKEEEKE